MKLLKSIGILIILLVLLPLIIVMAGLITVLFDDTPDPAATAGAAAGGVSDRVPAEYAADVVRAGSLCPEITPALIAAQIQQESGWQTHAESSAAAKGISQFIDSTWAAMGTDGDGDGIADVNNPHDAIFSQGKYMCDNVANIKPLLASGAVTGDIAELALAAYNAGLGAVQTHGGIPPYAETRAYVATITAQAPSFAAPAPGAAGGSMAAAIEWARGIAADDTHGYTLGATGPVDYDCSGLVQTAMARAGIDLPRTAHEQAQGGTTIPSLDQAQPGDLLFWGDPAHYYHVALYIGDGLMVSADTEASGINEEPLWAPQALIKRYQ